MCFEMRKIFVLVFLLILTTSSIAFGFVIGNSNLPIMGYPQFNPYLPYNPSKTDIEEYIRQAKEYIEGCDNDVDRIHEARQSAIRKANSAVDDYNRKN